MAEQGFERLVERLFDEAPAFADAPLFAARVESRLDRHWGVRNLLIGGLGLAGGVIGGAQILSSGLADRLGALTHHSRDVLQARFEEMAGAVMLPGGLSLSPEVVAMSLGLLAIAVGLGVTRLIRDI